MSGAGIQLPSIPPGSHFSKTRLSQSKWYKVPGVSLSRQVTRGTRSGADQGLPETHPSVGFNGSVHLSCRELRYLGGMFIRQLFSKEYNSIWVELLLEEAGSEEEIAFHAQVLLLLSSLNKVAQQGLRCTCRGDLFRSSHVGGRSTLCLWSNSVENGVPGSSRMPPSRDIVVPGRPKQVETADLLWRVSRELQNHRRWF
jgi:hypothetical protein